MPERNIVGDWPMNEGSGDGVFDFSGNGSHLTTFVGSVSWQTGKYGTSLNFPGVTNYVTGSALTRGLVDAGDITIVIWFKSDLGGSADQFLVRVGDTGLVLNNLPGYRWFPDVDGGSPAEVSAPTTAGKWYCLAVSHSGIHSNLYHNGILIQSINSVVIDMISTTGYFFGALNNAGIWDLDGKISHCVIYNRALSAFEIALLYRESFYRYPENRVFAVA